MFYIFYGEDDFSMRESIRDIIAKSGGEELSAGDISSFNGSKVSINELMAACNTISFMSPKRIVFVEGLLERFEGKSKKGRSSGGSPELKEWSAFPDQVANMPESTVLILTDGKLSKSNSILKKLLPSATVKEHFPIKGRDLENWISSRITANGCTILPSAVRLLINLIGGKLWILSSEIDKLCLHAGSNPISNTDINLLVSNAREANVFTMVDAIVQRRLQTASRLMHQLLDEGSAPPYLLFMITRQFRMLIQAKSLTANKISKNEIGKKIGLSSGFALDKTMEQVDGFSAGQLEDIYRKLLDTDISIKTGAMDPELAIDLLITDLCTG